MDALPFLPFWAVMAVVWASMAAPSALSRGQTRTVIAGSLALGVGLAIFAPTVWLVVGGLLAWSMWLFVVVSIGSDKANPQRRRVDVITLNLLALAVVAGTWAWNRPATVVQRLGSTAMAQRATDQVEAMQVSGRDMVPYLLAGLEAGTGHYWLQSSGWVRDEKILGILARWKAAGAVPLVGALMAEKMTLVEPAIAYLRAVGGGPAVEVLLTYGEGHPDRFQEPIASALKSITGQSFGTDWKRWRQWQKTNP